MAQINCNIIFWNKITNYFCFLILTYIWVFIFFYFYYFYVLLMGWNIEVRMTRSCVWHNYVAQCGFSKWPRGRTHVRICIFCFCFYLARPPTLLHALYSLIVVYWCYYCNIYFFFSSERSAGRLRKSRKGERYFWYD